MMKPLEIRPPAVRQTRLLIDGAWTDAADEKTFETVNPATEEVIARVAEASAEDVDRAVLAARRAFDEGPWPRMSGRERGARLTRLADLVEAHREELAGLETLDAGKVVAETYHGDVPQVALTFRYFAGWADKLAGETLPAETGRHRHFCYTRREPVGVCGQIIPWNFPLLMAAWKIAPAVAAGNTIVLKPAEQTPLSALRLGELALEAGLPPGVLNIVNGFGPSAGAALVKHPGVDKIAFTGEHRTAQAIMADAAATLKRTSFELGGKSPNLVFADADLKRAVNGAAIGIFYNQGQVCTAGSRLFVEESVHDEFVERLTAAAERRVVGDPFDAATTQGALVSKAHFEKVMSYVGVGLDEDGARLVTGGERVGDRGFFVRPTIFAGVRNEMRIAREEIFGPVLSVIPFAGFDDVVRQANDTPFGLAAAIWTRDITRALGFAERVRAGTVWVNCIGTFDVGAPFGGFKYSGHGREMGRVGIEEYTELKTVWINLGRR